MSDEMEPGHFSDVPHHVKKLLVNGIPLCDSEDEPDEMRELFDRARHGRCMLCKKRLGKTTMLGINRNGIMFVYCSGQCHDDMTVMGWLQEEHQDLSEKIDLRGIELNQHDPTPEDGA